jgi:non-canonical poly(A) RNA polymerase PAPD5/7
MLISPAILRSGKLRTRPSNLQALLTPIRLHNEILDFYDFVAPQPFEHEQRNKLVNRVNSALGVNRFPNDNGRVLCFGSFPAGLYLPTADMDLVYVSDRHYNGGPPVVDLSARHSSKSLLHKAAARLTQTRLAADRPQVIPARIPIIKYKDSLTGLQVDISFENLSGVQAQATFAQWKRQYPDMIYMVALLKQFLVMHGLNEVHTGGIGGYSIICLIVSYIQHNPKPENLGECFLGFLKYYGNFDLSRKRIQMHPPAIIDKVSEFRGFAAKTSCVCLQAYL